VKSAVFLGLATVDVVYAVESMPRENEKIVATRQEVLCGGPATNAAITCAFLGGPAVLVSSVGTHPLATVIHEGLRQFDIPLVDLNSNSKEMPPISSILVSESGNRAVISAHSTRKQIAAGALNESILENAAILMVDGHHMACAIRAAELAKMKDIPVVLDGGSWKDGTDELLKCTRIAICSDDFRPPGISEASEVIAYLLNQGVESVAITRGAKPVLWATRDQSGEIGVPSVTAVDTLGAGDILHGAFCYQNMRGASLTDSLKFAAEVAAHSCRSFGTRAWMESWKAAKK
jgi:sugar/nucleoside kinase (ribokinase family)